MELTKRDGDGLHKVVINFDNVTRYAAIGGKTRIDFVSAQAFETSPSAIVVEESVAQIETLLAQGGEIVVRVGDTDEPG